jgi:hypothetical protein
MAGIGSTSMVIAKQGAERVAITSSTRFSAGAVSVGFVELIGLC